MTSPFLTVRQILERVQLLHRRQRQHIAHSVAAADGATMGAIRDYLQRRESDLLATLSRYTESGEQRVLDTHVQSPPAAALTEAIEADWAEPAEPATMARRCLERDAALVQAYEQLALSPTGPRVREMFANLAELERVNQRRLGRALSTDERLDDRQGAADLRSEPGD